MMRWTVPNDALLRRLFAEGYLDREIAPIMASKTGEEVTAVAVIARRQALKLLRQPKRSAPKLVHSGWPNVPHPEDADRVLLTLILEDLRRAA